MAADNPKPDERVCFNCALASALECCASTPRTIQAAAALFCVPSRRYTCEHFEARGGAAKEAGDR